MTNFNKSRAAARAACASAVVTLSSITPAFAAALDPHLIAGQLTPRNIILLTSLVLLAVALGVKLTQKRRNSTEAAPDEPDLRWWLNAQ